MTTPKEKHDSTEAPIEKRPTVSLLPVNCHQERDQDNPGEQRHISFGENQDVECPRGKGKKESLVSCDDQGEIKWLGPMTGGNSTEEFPLEPLKV